MQTILVLTMTAVALCLGVIATASLDTKWEEFKTKFEKEYTTPDEEKQRRDKWEQNLKAIESHNTLFTNGQATYSLGENKYSDLSPGEFRKIMSNPMVQRKELVNQNEGIPDYLELMSSSTIQDEVDWRDFNFVTNVKDQGYCGDCWAFSATGSLEGQHYNNTKQLVSLSESYLVDCCREEYENNGCQGGHVMGAFSCIINLAGIATEASWRYRPWQQKCLNKDYDVGAVMYDYSWTLMGDESNLKYAVAKVGPVSASINIDLPEFQNYKKGVFDHPSCNNTEVNHSVLIVGYGHDEGSSLDYWIVKNSWGLSWGDDGYILMARNKDNQCGIANEALYPIV